jgi:hypothetical protein
MPKNTYKDLKSLRTNERGTTADIPLALFTLLFALVLPLADLIGMVTGASLAFMITQESAMHAVSKRTFEDALLSVNEVAEQYEKSSVSKFIRMKPIGGYKANGTDLYVVAANYRTDVSERYGPNKPFPFSIDPSTYLYQYSVSTDYQVGPIVDLSFVPLFAETPGLGKPAVFRFTASRTIEDPTGLEADLPKKNQP